jgi:hypothetical protein
MKLDEFKRVLLATPGTGLRFVLPGGEAIPEDFHVTEVGHVAKRFIDCGGTVREGSACVLQVWVARNDADHRLGAGRLASILDMARTVVPSDDLEVEVEYEAGEISQYPVLGAEVSDERIVFRLGRKHTDCLAREACGLEPCGSGAPADGCCSAP